MQRETSAKKPESKEYQIFNNVCSYFSLLEMQENILQAHREALTTRTDFHPLTLFNYLARSDGILTRRSFLALLQENNFPHSEEHIKILFGLYGYKEKMDFGGFLNYIYPSSIEPLKYISTVGLKKYSGIPVQEPINQEIVCLTVLLVAKEMEFIQDLQNFKQDHFPRMSKSQVKKLLKMIKKKGESKSMYEIQSESVVTFNEMRICLRKSRNMQENKINSICRKLSMGKDNFISLEQMEFWLKSWNRIKEENFDKENPKTLLEDFQTSILT